MAAVAALLAILVMAPRVSARQILYVPSPDYQTVVDALNAAMSGDEVVLSCSMPHYGDATLGPGKDGVILRAESSRCATFEGRLEVQSSIEVRGISFVKGDVATFVTHDVGSIRIVDCSFENFDDWRTPIYVSNNADVELDTVYIEASHAFTKVGMGPLTIRNSEIIVTTEVISNPSAFPVSIEGSTFRRASPTGTAVTMTLPRPLTAIDSEFDGVKVSAFNSYGSGDVSFTKCTFQNVFGEMALRISTSSTGNETVRLDQCDFINNKPGAVSVSTGPSLTQVIKCQFIGNEAQPITEIFEAAAITVEGDGSLEIEASTFSGNRGNGVGGVRFNSTGDLVVNDCTFYENSTNSSADYIPAHIEVDNGTFTMNRCIVAGGTGKCAVAVETNLTTMVSCTDIHGNSNNRDWTGPYAGPLNGLISAPDNVSVDPVFCEADPHAARDWRLSATASPASVTSCGMGAWKEGAHGCTTTAIQTRAWSSVKELYR